MRLAAEREIELKFLFRPEDRAQVEALPSFRAALLAADRKRLGSIYFDTPDQYLWKRGLSLRVRKIGDHLVETVKQETGSGIERGEWESRTESPIPDLAFLEKTPLADFIDGNRIKGDLRPAFAVDVERTSFLLVERGARIEGAIDVGHIESENEKLAICELELELKQGDCGALFDLARMISAEAPVQLSFISKAERGHRVAEGLWGRSAKGSKPRLGAGMTCREAFQVIARTCLHDFMLNEAALATADEVEAVHQARVAVRRLRAAMTLFSPMLGDAAFADLRARMKRLAGLLGEARDLDVISEKWPRLAERIAAGRGAAHRAICEAIQTECARRCRVDLVAWIDTGDWRQEFADVSNAPMSDFVVARLKKRRKNLVSRGRDLEHLDSDTRHQIRIEAKKLRYMAEFFAKVQGVAKARKRFEKFVRSLEDLQLALGEMHDHDVGAAMVAEAAGLSPEEAKVELAAAKADTSKDLAKAIRAHERLARTRPF